VIPLNFDKKAILTSTVASTVMGPAVYLIAAQTSFTLVLLPFYVITGVAIFTAILTTTKTMEMEDVQLILKIPGDKIISQKVSKTANNSKLLTLPWLKPRASYFNDKDC